jgi:hypothetical protein
MRATRPFCALPLAAVLLALSAAAGGCEDAPADACRMEVLTHVDPLPRSANPFDYRYSEVAARDGVAYLGASHGAGVQMIDVATGERLGALAAGVAFSINSVAVAGDLLAFAPGVEGIVVYDISDPRRPGRRAARKDPVPYCHTVFIHEDIVYCSTSSPRDPHVAMYRVTRPADPELPLEITPAGSYSDPLTPEEQQSGADIIVHDVFVHRRDDRVLAYLAYWERGLQIVDVTDPASPQRVGQSAPTPTRWTHSVWVDGPFAYVGEESYKGLVRVFDVADPANPHEVGQLRSSEGDAVSAHNVQVANGVLYASWYQDGLRAFAARGAAAPEEIGYFHTWNGADNRNNPAPSDIRFAGNWDVFVDGDRIYAADMQTGLWVLRHQTAGAACQPDRSRGTSAFAKTGRPPFGLAGFLPRQVRTGRTVPVMARVTSVDPYFAMSDDITRGLKPRLRLAGARMLGEAEVMDVSVEGQQVPYRLVRATAEVPARPGGTLLLTGTLDDEGAPRSATTVVELLAEAPPNQDSEPNETEWVSGVLRPDAAGRARCAGTLSDRDGIDLYALDRPAGELRIRLVSGATAGGTGDPERPAILLLVSRTNTGRQEFGMPERRPLPEATDADARWEQVVTVPAGQSERLWIAAVDDRLEGDTPLRYTLEVGAP